MEFVVPARIQTLQTVDSGEIQCVQLALPKSVTIQGATYPLMDSMRPGTAFLAKPWGARTGKYRRRMYTRSNSSFTEPGLLETFINHTHQERTDTSEWWQSEMVQEWYESGQPIDVRLQLDQTQGIARVYENTQVCKPANLRLEEDGEWEGLRLVCVAFGTGVTPFLSYLRYLAGHQFGQNADKGSAHLTLIASVRHEGQLMLHDELLQLEQQFSGQFRYQPVLTRSWPEDWSYLKGRVIREFSNPVGKHHIDVSPLLDMVPDWTNVHLRACGSVTACRQLTLGIEQQGITPRSIRTESW